MNDTPPRAMSTEECWQALREHEFGRLAFHLLGDVHMTPINYAVDEDGLLFRTAEGNKLLGVVMHGSVAFEIDELTDDEAWSVVVRGKARLLEGDEEYRAERVPLRPWVGDDKHHVVEIVPEEVSGRRFRLSKPCEHILPAE